LSKIIANLIYTRYKVAPISPILGGLSLFI
jgi:hypothetical protein